MTESKHGLYFVMLILLMVSVFIASAPLVLFYVSELNFLSYIMTAILAYIFGHISAKFIENITHKEKKEVLAGTVIPLPAVIGISMFLVIADNFGQISTLNSIYTSMLYFICFNIPFLVYFYEHERHKHHLIGFLFAPMVLALVYTFTLLISSILASYSITPLVEEITTSEVEYTGVTNFITDCMKITARQKMSQGYLTEEDIESYINININSCIGGFKAFKGQEYMIEAGKFESDVAIGNTTVAVRANYPITIKEGTKIKQISRFSIILEKEVE